MDQKRVFLALALSLGVLFIWQMFFAPDPPVDPKGKDQTNGAVSSTNNGDSEDNNGGASVNNPPSTNGGGDTDPPPVPVEDIDQEDFVLKTKAYKAVFTNRGARLKSYEILDPEQYGPRGDLIPPVQMEDKPPVGDRYLEYLPFGTTFSGTSLSMAETAMYEVTTKTDTGVTFRYTDPKGRFVLEKSYTENPDKPFSFKADVKLENTSGGDITDALGMVMYGHQPEGEDSWSPLNPIPDTTAAICYAADSVERGDLDDSTEGMKVEGPVKWGGVDSRYFVTSAITTDWEFVECEFDVREKQFVRTVLNSETFTLRDGESRDFNMISFVGPKLTDRMKLFEVGLDGVIDYGIFEILCRPIHWLLVLFYGWVGNWGIAIILLTILLRTLMFPINHKSYKNMEGMRRIQKPMEEIRAKYKNDPLKAQEKIMEMYKKEGVSPFGCLPQMLQIPIFFALYRTIYNSAELFHADFFGWYTDLSAPDPYYILPVLVGAAMFGQQLLMPATTTNPQMKYAMYIMPVVFSAFVFVLPSGLALYIVTSVSLGIAQQFYIRRSFKKKAEATS